MSRRSHPAQTESAGYLGEEGTSGGTCVSGRRATGATSKNEHPKSGMHEPCVTDQQIQQPSHLKASSCSICQALTLEGSASLLQLASLVIRATQSLPPPL